MNHFTRGCGALRGIGRETAQDDALDIGVEIADEARRRDRLVSAARALASEELEHHQAERVQIAAHRGLLSAQLFRRHVRGRAGDRAVVFVVGERESEVHDLRLAARVDHDVGRLQVAMQDPFRVRGHQTRRDAARDVDRFVFGESTDAPQQLREVFAVDVLHRDEVLPFPVDDVVDAADVRMRDLATETHFIVQSAEEDRVAREAGGKELQRDRLVELRVVGAIDLAHAAGAEEAGDAVAAGDDRAGRELRLEGANAGSASRIGLDARGDVSVAGGSGHGRLRNCTLTMGMTSVLYFHGFASSPASAKITALRPLLAPHGIELNAPDLNVPSFERLDLDAVLEHALECAHAIPPQAIVGSSLGALIALSVARRGLALPLVLIAPALGIAQRWKSRIPDGDPIMVFNYARNADAPIHRAFFDQITELYVDDEPPPSRVTVVMGRKDETVPFDVVEETWRKWETSGRLVAGSRFIELDEGDHSLVAHAEIIRDAIREAAS